MAELAKQFDVTTAGLSIAAKRMTEALPARLNKLLRTRYRHAERLPQRGNVVDS